MNDSRSEVPCLTKSCARSRGRMQDRIAELEKLCSERDKIITKLSADVQAAGQNLQKHFQHAKVLVGSEKNMEVYKLEDRAPDPNEPSPVGRAVEQVSPFTMLECLRYGFEMRGMQFFDVGSLPEQVMHAIIEAFREYERRCGF